MVVIGALDRYLYTSSRAGCVGAGEGIRDALAGEILRQIVSILQRDAVSRSRRDRTMMMSTTECLQLLMLAIVTMLSRRQMVGLHAVVG